MLEDIDDGIEQEVVTNQGGSRRRPGRSLARRTAIATAALLAMAGLAVTGAASWPALAAPRSAQPVIPAWRVVKRVPHGSFNVIITVGKKGGWAFDNSDSSAAPTA